MVAEFIKRANSGNCVYITDVKKAFDRLPKTSEVVCILQLLDKKEKTYTIKFPELTGQNKKEIEFVRNYLYANIYNILSTFGGTKMTFYFNTGDRYLFELIHSLDEAFGIKTEKENRKGYGKCINVTERMIEKLCGGTFSFEIKDISQRDHKEYIEQVKTVSALQVFSKAAKELQGKTLCGMDIGGTDIKIAVSKDEKIICFKEYDWFPAQFTTINQLIDPIVLLTRLVRAKISLDYSSVEKPLPVLQALDTAMQRDAKDKEIQDAVILAENLLKEDMQLFNGMGLCFPDVVVKDKIVGGEVYKTRGIRENTGKNYDMEFKKLTDLDMMLCKYCKESGAVKIINDGPMAAFTAAVELSASGKADEVENGVFAHTLGTELGTGWIDENGEIPDIPLEVYNYIIDLGNYPSKAFDPDDVRSINNFNTGLPGTLQKYTSQSGVFRLAARYFSEDRIDLYEELFKKGFIIKNADNGCFFLQTEPKDLRKPFLEYIMELAEHEDCAVCRKIFIEIGEYLAVTWEETQYILQPKAKSRILFGRLVKKKACYNLMLEGAKKINPDIEMFVADGDLASTVLMKQLKEHRVYTVAQFAQAVGAIYYINLALLNK